jgi:hypothetical protein
MRFTIRPSLSFILIAFSASCAPVATPKPTEQSATIPAITQTYTPTVTKTPTEANTPTETPVPTPDFYKGIPPGREQLVKITPEQALLKAADILAHPGLTGKPTRKYGVETDPANGGANIFITGWYGDSVLIDTGATIVNPDGGPDMDVLFIEFLNPDGTHRVAVVCFDGIFEKDKEKQVDNVLQRLWSVARGQILQTVITTILGQDDPNYPYNPVAVALTDNAPDKNKELFKKLRQSGLKGGSSILPDGIEQIVLYGTANVSYI